ncbi:MAG: ketoacyl-ACP synthase III [Chloroflexi bacterium]|nr:ketoacyl-ACP synthase III [Chloroflexota bacterium]
MRRGVRIAGWGKYVPQRVLTNADLERMVDTSDEWITTRTGIKERRLVADDESTSSMATAASLAALKQAGTDPSQVQLIICATITPEYQFPSVACLLQSALGCQAAAFDLHAACSGFIYAVATGSQFIENGIYERVLVVGAETLSRITDWTDRSTCVLFGDGAGAVYLEATTGESDLRATWLGADGSNPSYLYMDSQARPSATTEGTAGESTCVNLLPPAPPQANVIRMDGREVFRFSTRILVEAVQRVAEQAAWKLDEIDLIVPHQANYRIILSASNYLGVPLDRFYLNVQRYGNTSAASVPIALTEAVAEGRLQPGHKVVLVAFGGGLTWGALALQWPR